MALLLSLEKIYLFIHQISVTMGTVCYLNRSEKGGHLNALSDVGFRGTAK